MFAINKHLSIRVASYFFTNKITNRHRSAFYASHRVSYFEGFVPNVSEYAFVI